MGRKILKSKLNGGNIIKAINSWAVPVVRYTAGIIDWIQAELKDIDRKNRKFDHVSSRRIFRVFSLTLQALSCT